MSIQTRTGVAFGVMRLGVLRESAVVVVVVTGRQRQRLRDLSGRRPHHAAVTTGWGGAGASAARKSFRAGARIPVRSTLGRLSGTFLYFLFIFFFLFFGIEVVVDSFRNLCSSFKVVDLPSFFFVGREPVSLRRCSQGYSTDPSLGWPATSVLMAGEQAQGPLRHTGPRPRSLRHLRGHVRAQHMHRVAVSHGSPQLSTVAGSQSCTSNRVRPSFYHGAQSVVQRP